MNSEEVANEFSKQELQWQTDLIRLEQIADVIVKERRVFHSDVAVVILDPQTGEVEKRLLVDAEILFELD